MTNEHMDSLTFARYGKDNVRICKVERNEKTGIQSVAEMTICVLLEGDIDSSYTQADNSVIVATDSMKNTIYIKAKECSVTPPEFFASVLGNHFIETYPHIRFANVKITTHRWARMNFNGKQHAHSFFRDGTEIRNTEAKVQKGKFEISSSLNGLTVFKSTGSQFFGFIRDKFTTLPEVWDRILSTDINCTWTWKPFESIDFVKKAIPKFDQAWSDVRNITMKVFAEENSPSVQNTVFKMCTQILRVISDVQDVEYKLPNKHFNVIDLSWHKGIKDEGENSEVYLPLSDPNGLIELKLTRPNISSKL